jgi:hypothetical protein
MRWKTGAFTTVGFRACTSVRHNEDTMNRAEGIMVKNNCSNSMLKSNCLEFSWNKSSLPVVKGILIVYARGNGDCITQHELLDQAREEVEAQLRLPGSRSIPKVWNTDRACAVSQVLSATNPA